MSRMGFFQNDSNPSASPEPEPCPCDEALLLRDLLALASRGKAAVHLVKEAGYWSVEQWEDGKLVKGDIGVRTAAEALDRASKFIRRIEGKQGEVP